jgi:hypothetical protein
VGIFLASRVTYILAFVRLCCVECRAGTSIFGRFAGVGGGPVRIFYFPGSVLACFARLKWGGWAGQYGFSSSLVLFGGYGTIEMAGLCCIFLFIFF